MNYKVIKTCLWAYSKGFQLIKSVRIIYSEGIIVLPNKHGLGIIKGKKDSANDDAMHNIKMKLKFL